MLFCYVGKELSMRNIKADTSGCWIERERERVCETEREGRDRKKDWDNVRKPEDREERTMVRAIEENIERDRWVCDRRQQVKELERGNTQRNRDRERKVDRKREKQG